jgi:hypothetical protein
MDIICDGYLEAQVSNENFVSIQQVIDGIVDKLPEEGFTHRLTDTYWAKGTAIVVCQNEETRDWLGSKVPTLKASEGCRLKMVGLDTLPTYKRVVAWFPGPLEDTERNFRQLCTLNQGLDTSHWRVYELKKYPSGVCFMPSIDSSSVVALLKGMEWRPFSSVGQLIFSLLCVKPEGQK